MQELLTVYRIYKRSTAPKYKDPICCNSCMVMQIRYAVILAWFCPCFGQSFIFFARHQLDTWTLAPPPPEDTWYGVILWVLRVLGQGLKSECADIFHQSFLWLLRHTDEPQKGRNSCLWLQSRSVFSSVGVVLMSCKIHFHVVRSPLQYSACKI